MVSPYSIFKNIHPSQLGSNEKQRPGRQVFEKCVLNASVLVLCLHLIQQFEKKKKIIIQSFVSLAKSIICFSDFGIGLKMTFK